MKQITILQENISPIIIDDNDDRDIQEYINELSTIVDSNSVVLLHTSSCSLILRPSKLCSIVVKDRVSIDKTKIDEPDKQKVTKEKTINNIKQETPQQKEVDSDIIEDVITD